MTMKALVAENRRSEEEDHYLKRAWTEWLEKIAENGKPRYSAEAIQFIVNQLKVTESTRKGRWSPSGLGGCMRKQQFGFLGAGSFTVPSLSSQQLFELGNWLHMQWQAAGLTEGWLVAAEQRVDMMPNRIWGHVDGITHRDHVFDLKTVGAYTWGEVIDKGVEGMHHILAQMHAYLTITGRTEARVVFYHRDSGDVLERVVIPTDEDRENVILRLDSLNNACVSDDAVDLFPMEDVCRLAIERGSSKHAGMQPYRLCDLKHICAYFPAAGTEHVTEHEVEHIMTGHRE